MRLRGADAEVLQLAASVLDTEAAALSSAKKRLGRPFVEAVRIILSLENGGRAVVMGIGKSGHVGRKIAATLASTGTPALFVHPAEAGHGDLGMITSSDAVLAISYSGQSDELLRTIPYFKRHRIRLIAMTAQPQSALAASADCVIDTSVDREACPLGLAPTASTTLTLALGDAIAMCLLKARGFTAEMFAVTHPHGALGRRLLVTVADVMMVRNVAPTVPESTTIREALMSMSKGGVGFTNVLDAQGGLAGIFTDGDLRRALDRDVDIKSQPISSVMTRHYVVARPQQLAVEAVELMEKYKISSLPVVDDRGQLVGAINMRMLLQAGVV